jgi:Rrf2 family protein
MRLSTRTRYAIRAIIEMAENYGKGPLQLKSIAQHQDISVKYLEQIVATLKTGGFIKSMRGAKGGYILAKPPNRIKLIDVFDYLEGPISTVECVENEDYCVRSADCVARQLWQQVNDAIKDVLSSITLQDLVDKVKDKLKSDYQI